MSKFRLPGGLDAGRGLIGAALQGVRPGAAERGEEDLFTAHLIGEAPRFRAAVSVVHRVAAFPATVLILGETGTGKEVVARAIHYLRPGRQGPFVPVNCGAIPDSLVESELFGHTRGAFTGAVHATPGFFSLAEGGTLFLDEVECLSPKCQAALLRTMQDQAYRPVGSRQLVQGHVRIIAASNRDLQSMVDEGVFRQDLLFRLNVLCVELPSLRERISDIPLLARHFIRNFAHLYGLAEKRLGIRAEQYLMTRRWPGNVRELENVIHRAFLLSEGTELGFDHEAQAAQPEPSTPKTRTSAPPQKEDWASIVALPDPEHIPLPTGLSFSAAKEQVIEDFEKRYLSRLMSDTGGNVSLAARLCGKERRTFSRLLKKHGLASSD